MTSHQSKHNSTKLQPELKSHHQVVKTLLCFNLTKKITSQVANVVTFCRLGRYFNTKPFIFLQLASSFTHFYLLSSSVYLITEHHRVSRHIMPFCLLFLRTSKYSARYFFSFFFLRMMDILFLQRGSFIFTSRHRSQSGTDSDMCFPTIWSPAVYSSLVISSPH